MARAIWDGEISFGLINIQVKLHTATKTKEKVSFNLLDKRDGSRVRYQRVNEETGEEVPWDQVVKGYEFEEDNYIMLDDEKLQELRPELTKTIDLEEFVDIDDVSVLLFDKPYYLVPSKRSYKPYVLLREILKEKNKAGIGKVVIRTTMHLALLFPVEDALVLNLLFFPEEIKPLSDFEFPEASDYTEKIKPQEIALSSELVDSMSASWDPDKYFNDYNENLKEAIQEEVESQQGSSRKKSKKGKKAEASNVINIEELLKRSLKNNKQEKMRKGS